MKKGIKILLISVIVLFILTILTLPIIGLTSWKLTLYLALTGVLVSGVILLIKVIFYNKEKEIKIEKPIKNLISSEEAMELAQHIILYPPFGIYLDFEDKDNLKSETANIGSGTEGQLTPIYRLSAKQRNGTTVWTILIRMDNQKLYNVLPDSKEEEIESIMNKLAKSPSKNQNFIERVYDRGGELVKEKIQPLTPDLIEKKEKDEDAKI